MRFGKDGWGDPLPFVPIATAFLNQPMDSLLESRIEWFPAPKYILAKKRMSRNWGQTFTFDKIHPYRERYPRNG
jgi:hypothetical protein